MCEACRGRAVPAAVHAGVSVAEAPAARPAPARLDPELLQDERMALARMASVRSQLALGVQQHGTGNAALARMLARETTAAAPKAKLTGKQLDGMLTRSSFFKPYIAPRIKEGIKAEGHVHMHDPDGFRDAAVAYLRTGENPATGRLFTEEEAKAFEPELRGFTDEGEIHISSERADDGTLMHEALHLFSSTAFVQGVGYVLNEGVTEFLTRKLAAENGMVRAGMPGPFRYVFRLKQAIGPEADKLLADAYFKNELQPLKDALDAKKGAGTWAKWQPLVEADDVRAASDLV